MGKKVDPRIIRLGITRKNDSLWYADKNLYTDFVIEDYKIRKCIRDKFPNSGISKIEIQRSAHNVKVFINTSKPGIIIGREGASISELKTILHKKFNKIFDISVNEIRNPYSDAYVVAEMVGNQISRRLPFRRVCKMMIEKVMESGVKGVRIRVSGRLNGVDIARSEVFNQGKVPLQTFRADIDFARFRADTTFGVIGVKVYIYRGDVFDKMRNKK